MRDRPITSPPSPAPGRVPARRDGRDLTVADGTGAGFDRRRLLSLFGAGAAAAGLAACGGSSGSAGSSGGGEGTGGGAAASGEIPEETAGPYPGDGSNGPDVLEQDGVIRSDIRSSFGDASGTAEGVPMSLELTVTDLANGGAPFSAVAVYAWHCDREGRYSLYSEGVTGENYLRGVQIADSAGKVHFTSIFPACYTGRWPHVHFEVYPDQASITDSTKAIATSQLAFPKEVCDRVYAQAGYEQSVSTLSQLTLESDNIFGDDGGDSQRATVTGDPTAGYTVTLTVGVDTRTAAGGGRSGGGSGGGGGEPGAGGAPPGGGYGGTPPSGAPGRTPPSGAPDGMLPGGGPGGTPPTGTPG